MRALANVNGKGKKDSIAEEPSFDALSKLVKPKDATVWVDQARLNQDMYFKHYWLMSKTKDLVHIRSAMFDLEIKDDKWIERREFLSEKRQSKSLVPFNEAERLKAMIPADSPYLQLKAFDNEENRAGDMINNTLFDRLVEKNVREKTAWNTYDELSYGNYYYDGEQSYRYYSHLSEEFDETIDGVENEGNNDETKEARLKGKATLQSSIQPAGPVYSIMVTRPQTIKEPFFTEFHKGIVMTLQKPSRFDAQSFEQAIVGLAAERVFVQGAKTNLQWTDAQYNGLSWRELGLPIIGWKFCYKLKDKDLIVTNDTGLIRDILTTGKGKAVDENNPNRNAASVESMTIIRFDQRAQAFDEVVRRVNDEKAKAFFAGNIASLLDTLSDVSRVEIKRHATAKGFHEDVTLVLSDLR